MKSDRKDTNKPQPSMKATLLSKEMKAATNRFLEKMAELTKRLEQVDH